MLFDPQRTTTIHGCTSARNVHCSFKMTSSCSFGGLLICTEAKMGDQVNHWTSIEDNCYLVSKPPNRLTVPPDDFPWFLQTFARNTVPKICFQHFESCACWLYFIAFCVLFFSRMVGCTPFTVVSYFYLWFVPPFTNGRFMWYLGFYCLYQTLITVSILCFDVFKAVMWFHVKRRFTDDPETTLTAPSIM